MRKYQELNAKAWDWEHAHGNVWTNGSDAEAVKEARKGLPMMHLTPVRYVDLDWIRPAFGKRVLCLGSGGGQQAVLFAAAGCTVTDLDISPAQLEADRSGAARYGVTVRTEQGDMQDLSRFDDRSFDLVFNPTSTCFIDDPERMYREAWRVLVPGGSFLTSATNPAMYLFDEKKALKNKLKVKYTIPYSDLKSLARKDLDAMERRNDTFEFSHTLDVLLGGICRAGFLIQGLSTDYSDNEAMDSFLHDCFIAVKAVKPCAPSSNR